jgi:hypothetical protein
VLVAAGNGAPPIMIGGAFQLLDAHGETWATTGIAVAVAPERSGEPAVASDASGPGRISGWDDGISAFPRSAGHVEPLVDIAQYMRAQMRQRNLQEPGT